jgi:hypothetical protein
MSLTAALRDLNKINAFVRVAERRSFTKAAVDLRTTVYPEGPRRAALDCFALRFAPGSQ